MRAAMRGMSLEQFMRLRRTRRVQTAATLGLIILGPVLAVSTYLVFGPLDQGASSMGLRLVLLADLVYVIVVAALVLQRIAEMISARRAHSAGSRLHLRLTGAFTGIAVMPTILVAIFAVLTVNVGLEGWFSDRVREVVRTSLAAAQAYEQEHRTDLSTDADALAGFLEDQRRANFILSDGQLRQELTQGQQLIQRGLSEAYVIDGTGEIRARGERSYLFGFEQPDPEAIAQARAGETVIIEDWDNNEFRALTPLDGFLDRFLYVSRSVDGDLLALLDDTQKTVGLYTQLESERGRILFEFGLLYIGFAVILILAAIWLGLWFAERLSRPVGRLAGAVQRVGAGDLEVQLKEEQGDDEIAMLGRIFNQMTRQLKAQRDALLDTNAQVERRRRLFDSVLSSVTSGVIGLDAQGQLTFVNRSAEKLLGLPPTAGATQTLSLSVPEFVPLFDRLRASRAEVAQEEIRLGRSGKLENLLVRIATRRNEDGHPEGYVIAFDDVTDLVTAQRMAAWGDVARRIAHEIKNPLTPIQLSAERLKRKFAPKVGDEADTLIQYTDVIIRQTGDLRRIVDEFSKFARMPEPDRRVNDLTKLLEDAVVLQEEAMPGVAVSLVRTVPDVTAEIDATMMNQALTNLIKNAGEAIESLHEAGAAPEDHEGEVRVAMEQADTGVIITISDNGIGLPEDRARLFEPYVTTREKGTGLGLPIVKKIIEEHGGTLILTDADPFTPGARRGARAEIRLPAAIAAGRQDATDKLAV
ncbi:sensor histidine kinase NtrY-like [Anianabacter salinae]|uniref:sensor histidine kinase NtrY-like n=1 Tax=Anianabacter salinae TaxID=2851023 RepID=UPI00225E292A|nr:PAS domain-containing sensor histidine kinase [Anianabacter salinae]MBV0912122.1 PAS domain-containing sensor histidine kinase [Anianabacter salinae]